MVVAAAEQLYRKRFDQDRPDLALSLEDRDTCMNRRKRSGAPFEALPYDCHAQAAL
ncbi:MAG: hypothetical protein JOZ29_21575 [Deltaproteobacteria bacterium]|nr:hypothetical protein [Deltaproteobacteria bacterium]